MMRSKCNQNTKKQPAEVSVLSVCVASSADTDCTAYEYNGLTDAAYAVSVFAYFYLAFFTYRFYWNRLIHQFYMPCKTKTHCALSGA